MKEEYQIEVKTLGDYKARKEYDKKVMLTDREYVAFVECILDFMDKIEEGKLA